MLKEEEIKKRLKLQKRKTSLRYGTRLSNSYLARRIK
jgi:hypothetical protein